MKILHAETELNPVLMVEPMDVYKWLRQMVDDNGFSDRAIIAVQISVTQPFIEGRLFHHEVPTLACMVSNIKNSKGT